MDSTVRSRPNHYETLGLTPAASDAEIAQAFAREMSMFRARPMAAVAQISVAYETLRNPAKRRAYDESLGLRAKPPRAPVTAAFIGSAVARSAVRPAIDSLPRAVPKPQVRPDALPEGRLGSFIAESLREPTDAGVDAPVPPPEPKPQQRIEAAPVPDFLTFHPTEEESAAADPDARPIAWKRPAMAAGAVVLAVGLLGALAGSWSGSEADEARSAEPDMTVALPAAKPSQEIAALDATPAPEPPPVRTEARPQRSLPATIAKVERTRPPLELPTLAEEQQPAAAQTADNQAAAPAAEQAVAPSATAPAAVAASMPLSNATIARTIHRIGYACGQVASTSAADAPGEFKVTCTSGHSYQARPVRGRYHFRRL